MPPLPSKMMLWRLLKDQGFQCRRAIFKPILNKVKIQRRRDFANQYTKWTVQKWNKIIFSDEKIFRCRPGAKVKYWVRKGANRYLPKYVVKTEQKPQGVMIWAAINSRGQICLKRCPLSVKAQDYCDILTSAMTFIKPRSVLDAF